MKVKLVLEFTLDGCSIDKDQIDEKVQSTDLAFIRHSKQTSALTLAFLKLFKANTWDVKVSGKEVVE